MPNIFLNAVLEFDRTGTPDGRVRFTDSGMIFKVPSVSSLGTFFPSVGPTTSLPTNLDIGTPTSVNMSWNVTYSAPSDFSFPAVGGTMSVTYISLNSAGNAMVTRDNWSRTA
jgi:hypothetical protein